MSQFWQQILVLLILAGAAALALWYALSAYRSLRRGQCGHCSGCSTQPKSTPDLKPHTPQRIAFLPASNLRPSNPKKP